MANDITQLQEASGSALLLCEDARYLGNLPHLNVDCVLTSPPYLNGTNYFRNTKIELWFLRCLRAKSDLARFRFKAITAGINDVTVKKSVSPINGTVAGVLSRLELTNYDRRIPQMVAAYFREISDVVDAVQHHLASSGTLIVDIGDSAYSGVHIPTQKVLLEILEGRGFRIEDVLSVRRRLSRGGTPLEQCILVARRGGARVARSSAENSGWRSAWGLFKKTLPHHAGVFRKRNWGHPLHSACSYQGKMKPSLAAHLVGAFAPERGKLLDPFGGVGTIPFEAACRGMTTWCFDISPAALVIAMAKLGRADVNECLRSIGKLDAFIRRESVSALERATADGLGFNGSLPEYFHPDTFRELLLSRRYFLSRPPANASEALVLASLLHILHGNRPYALSRRSHPITPFAPTGPAEYRALIPRLREKVLRSLRLPLPSEFVPGRVLLQDATTTWPSEVDNLDAVITSPPFFDSTRFYLANWMRLWFCGWESADFKTLPRTFLDERQKASFAVYESVLRQARERLSQNGVLVLHLGQSAKCDMGEHLKRLAGNWFSLLDEFSENVEHCESHGIRDKGTVVAHKYLVFG